MFLSEKKKIKIKCIIYNKSMWKCLSYDVLSEYEIKTIW